MSLEFAQERIRALEETVRALVARIEAIERSPAHSPIYGDILLGKLTSDFIGTKTAAVTILEGHPGDSSCFPGISVETSQQIVAGDHFIRDESKKLPSGAYVHLGRCFRTSVWYVLGSNQCIEAVA